MVPTSRGLFRRGIGGLRDLERRADPNDEHSRPGRPPRVRELELREGAQWAVLFVRVGDRSALGVVLRCRDGGFDGIYVCVGPLSWTPVKSSSGLDKSE